MMQWRGFDLNWSHSGDVVTIARDGVVWVELALLDVVGARPAIVDPDEVQHTFDWGGVSVLTRSSLGQYWDLRWVVAAQNPTAVTLPALTLVVRPSPGHCGWVWATGADGVVAIAPADREGPVLAFTRRQGQLGFDPATADTGDPALPGLGGSATSEPGAVEVTPAGLDLQPGMRYVTTWRADLLPSIEFVQSLLPQWLPALELVEGEELRLDTPDLAVVAAAPLAARSDGAGVTIQGAPGRHEVILQGPGGTNRLSVCWAPGTHRVVAQAAAAVLAEGQPATAAGALVVSEALSHRLVAEPDDAEDYLESFDEQPDSPLLSAAALAAEAVRTGRSSRLAHARSLLAAAPVSLGYGRVALRVWLAGITLGEDAEAGSAVQFARFGEDSHARLELSLVGYRSPETGGPEVSGVINELGGPLPGVPLVGEPVVAAKLAGLLELTPEEWPLAARAAACAEKTRRRLLADVLGDPLRCLDVLAWLLVGVR